MNHTPKIQERTFTWVTDPGLPDISRANSKILVLVNQEKIVSNTITPVEMGILEYKFTLKGSAERLDLIQSLLGNVSYVPVQITIPTSSIKSFRGVSGNDTNNGVSSGDVLTACKKLVAAFTEKILHTIVGDVMITEEKSPDHSGYTTFTPTLDDNKFLIFRSEEIIESFKRSFPLSKLVGWQPIRTDDVTISVMSEKLPEDPKDIQVVSDVYLTRVGEKYDEYIDTIIDLARGSRSRGLVALRLEDREQREIFKRLSKVVQSNAIYEDDNQIMRVTVDKSISLGYDPTTWFTMNIDRLGENLPPIIRLNGWGSTGAGERAKTLVAARRVFVKTSTEKLMEAYPDISVLEDNSLIYPTISYDTVTKFQRMFHSYTSDWDQWEVNIVSPDPEGILPDIVEGLIRRLYLKYEMGIDSVLVSFDYHLLPNARSYYLVVVDTDVDPDIEVSREILIDKSIDIFRSTIGVEADRYGGDIESIAKLLVNKDRMLEWDEMSETMVARIEGVFG